MANVQPKSPQDEGIDPLTTGKTMYARENTQKLSKESTERQANAAPQTTDDEQVEPQTTEPTTSSR